MRAIVLSRWIEKAIAGGSAAVPEVGEAHALDGFSDVTGQQAPSLMRSPNLSAIEVRCDAAVLDAIAADSRFCVVWRESDGARQATNQERQATEDFLSEQGITLSVRSASRQQDADMVREHLRTLAKA